jgi:hypothetical protein
LTLETPLNGVEPTKDQFVSKVLAYCLNKAGYEDIVKILEPIISTTNSTRTTELESSKFGEVYLIKSGRHYKIGMTKDTVRRGGELKILLPERTDLIHSIKTDDPSGIEAYWHRRFADKRMNGEWFNLSKIDIRAFKRWRKIF